MPFASISQLPEQFQVLPSKAKQIALNVINSVMKAGGEEVSAIKQGWGAVKRNYTKSGDDWIARNATFTDIVTPHVVAFNDDGTVKFSYIAQTEGIHKDVVGKSVNYPLNILRDIADTSVGTKLSYDPKHVFHRAGRDDERPTFAEVISSEVVKLNEEFIRKHNMNPSLVGKHAVIEEAISSVDAYNERIRQNQLPFVSTEVAFPATIDEYGVYQPLSMRRQGGIMLENEGADPGAVLLQVYNDKYGGTDMTDETSPPAGGDETGKAIEEEKKKAEVAKTEAEEAKKETEEVKKEAEEVKAQNAKLEEEKKKLQEELEAANAKIDTTEKTDSEKITALTEQLGASNAKQDEFMKQIEAQNAKLEAQNSLLTRFRDEKRTTVLQEHVSNDKYIQQIIEQDLDEVAFNAKVEEIKALKEEAKEEAKKEFATNDIGISYPHNADNYADEFKQMWDVSEADMLKSLGVPEDEISA